MVMELADDCGESPQSLLRPEPSWHSFGGANDADRPEEGSAALGPAKSFGTVFRTPPNSDPDRAQTGDTDPRTRQSVPRARLARMSATDYIPVWESPIFVMRINGYDTLVYARCAADVSGRNFGADLISWGRTSLSGAQLGWGGIEVVLRYDLARGVIDLAMAPDNGPATSIMNEWPLDQVDPDRLISEAVGDGRLEDAFRGLLAVANESYPTRGTTETEVRDLAFEGRSSLASFEQADLERVLSEVGMYGPESLTSRP